MSQDRPGLSFMAAAGSQDPDVYNLAIGSTETFTLCLCLSRVEFYRVGGRAKT